VHTVQNSAQNACKVVISETIHNFWAILRQIYGQN